MSETSAAGEPLSLRALRLRPGMFLQAAPPDAPKRRTEAKFCAAIEGKGLMVVPLHDGPPGPEWRDQAALEISGFTGQYDFRFASRVLGSFAVPFTYVLLAWPTTASGKRVRSALRIKTSLPATVWRDDASAKVPARVLDLSHAGAMLDLATPTGGKGERIRIALQLPLDAGTQSLELSGPICHSGPGATGEGTRVGVAFEGVSRGDRLLLQNFTLNQLQGNGVVG